MILILMIFLSKCGRYFNVEPKETLGKTIAFTSSATSSCKDDRTSNISSIAFAMWKGDRPRREALSTVYAA